MLLDQHCHGQVPQHPRLLKPLEMSFISSKAKQRIPISAPPGTIRRLNLFAEQGKSGCTSSWMCWLKQRLLNYQIKAVVQCQEPQSSSGQFSRLLQLFGWPLLPQLQGWREQLGSAVSTKISPLLCNLLAHQQALGFNHCIEVNVVSCRDQGSWQGQALFQIRTGAPYQGSHHWWIGFISICMVPLPHTPWKKQCCVEGHKPLTGPMARHSSSVFSNKTTKWYR